MMLGTTNIKNKKKWINDVIATTEITLNSVLLPSNDLTPLFYIEFKFRNFRNIPQSFLGHTILRVLIPG